MHIKTFLTVKEREKKNCIWEHFKSFLVWRLTWKFLTADVSAENCHWKQSLSVLTAGLNVFYKRSRGWKDFQLMWVRRRSVQPLRSTAECLRIVLTLCGSLRHLDFRLTAFAFSSAALLTVEWGMLLIHSSIHLLLSSHSPLVERSSASFTVSFCWTFFFLFSPPVFLFTCFHLSKPPTHFLSLVSGG